MKGYIEERVLEIAQYIIDNNATVRQAAKHYGISKSTVHKDVTERLHQINPSLGGEVRKVLNVNRKNTFIRRTDAFSFCFFGEHDIIGKKKKIL